MTTPLQDLVAKLATNVAALEVLVGSMVPPTPPLVPPRIAGTSPDGTIIAAPGVGQSIIGIGPHTFTFGSKGFQDKGPEIWGYDILRDGVDYKLNAMWLTIKGGVVYALTVTNIWNVDTGSGWIPGAPYPAVVSPDGTTIIPGDGGYLLNAGLHLYTFGPASGSDYWILRDGPQYASGAAIKMTIRGGIIYALTASRQWYKDVGGNWATSAAPV